MDLDDILHGNVSDPHVEDTLYEEVKQLFTLAHQHFNLYRSAMRTTYHTLLVYLIWNGDE